ncbi:hypothetical protein PR048_018090 [Dryococelus australis]|uniref:Uncharacterized protein n=1 Tax=Dryococelus australis TaxID=614101 RepID=A0ABQ9HBF4_9NEOP|nr:hypothetical protein PR048_018090 [Dryococelus australis]
MDHRVIHKEVKRTSSRGKCNFPLAGSVLLTGHLGPVRCLTGIFRMQGVAGLYRGFHILLWRTAHGNPTLCARDVPAFGVYMLVYEKMTTAWPGPRGSVSQQILAGGTAGTYTLNMLFARIV